MLYFLFDWKSNAGLTSNNPVAQWIMDYKESGTKPPKLVNNNQYFHDDHVYLFRDIQYFWPDPAPEDDPGSVRVNLNYVSEDGYRGLVISGTFNYGSDPCTFSGAVYAGPIKEEVDPIININKDGNVFSFNYNDIENTNPNMLITMIANYKEEHGVGPDILYTDTRYSSTPILLKYVTKEVKPTENAHEQRYYYRGTYTTSDGNGIYLHPFLWLIWDEFNDDIGMMDSNASFWWYLSSDIETFDTGSE